jgi:hypothetical protein
MLGAAAARSADKGDVGARQAHPCALRVAVWKTGRARQHDNATPGQPMPMSLGVRRVAIGCMLASIMDACLGLGAIVYIGVKPQGGLVVLTPAALSALRSLPGVGHGSGWHAMASATTPWGGYSWARGGIVVACAARPVHPLGRQERGETALVYPATALVLRLSGRCRLGWQCRRPMQP